MHRNTGLGSWIARRARMTPERVALVFGERSVTYRELDERVTCLARALIERGIAPGDRVAFLGDNHPAALETLFACGLLGAIAVPIHPRFDDDAIAAVIEDAAPRVLVFTAELASTVERLRAQIEVERYITTGISGDAEWYEEILRGSSAEPIDRSITLEDPCLLGFSSGTTGRSKGVILSHGNMLFNALNLLSCVDYLRDDVILTSAPLYRMGGLGFTLAVFLKGGTCILQERADPELSLALIERHRVTLLFDAVASYQEMLGSPRFTRADLSSLRVCITGGSHVPPELIEAYLRRGLQVQQGYGLTEAAPLALLLDVDEVATRTGAGRPPIYGAVRVVDPDLEDVAPGETGELLYCGPNVMQGYWRDPSATARTLLPDGWLRTGDAAVSDPSGVVSVLGRMADALRLDGRRAHPAPIEASVRARSGAAECAIVQAAPEVAPTAFVVPPSDRSVDPEQVRQACRMHLPVRWLPEVRIVPALPKNANGKVTRDALRRVAVPGPGGSGNLPAPGPLAESSCADRNMP